MAKRHTEPPSLAAFDAADQDRQNRLLLDWLGDDEHRKALYALLKQANKTELVFWSRDVAAREGDGLGVEQPLKDVEVKHKAVTLVTDRTRIEKILGDDGTSYSNRIYAELGGGSFMLALDPKRALAHKAQRDAFFASFPHDDQVLVDLSHKACQAAAITDLRASDFDLASYAEQSALRYCHKLMGYGLKDYRLLQSALRAAYAALVYQVLGRHFATSPLTIPEAKREMGALLARTSALIDAYAVDDVDALKDCVDRDLPPNLTPVLKGLGLMRGDMNGEQRAVIALGAAIGTVGNVQAAACIAVKALFDDKARFDLDTAAVFDNSSRWAQARRLAASESAGLPTEQSAAWKSLLQDALRHNPPIPFLPRLKLRPDGSADGEVILALGAGTAEGEADDPLTWGLPTAGTHWCAGMVLAWPLIIEIVRQVMALPGLAQRLDAQDASVKGLSKRWGFACESYPLSHRRDRRLAQASLNVAMRLKAPVRDNADRVRMLIRAGAPRIEQALREARHVHFAWFELIESDSVLVLHTVYDGPFEAYVQHFALKVGDLFDLLFESIEDAPPTPVDQFPNEFVAHIQRFNRQPTMGYFFSAYPRSDVARIIRDEMARP